MHYRINDCDRNLVTIIESLNYRPLQLRLDFTI